MGVLAVAHPTGAHFFSSGLELRTFGLPRPYFAEQLVVPSAELLELSGSASHRLDALPLLGQLRSQARAPRLRFREPCQLFRLGPKFFQRLDLLL